ncbi:MAG TPA: hypothetical protein VHK28_05115 [Candidatus Limnocylindria bacterium]|jgi:hypothetical protein|nr:hypothetical protein [Candidatus Limnocylindria bacterium]
MTALRRVAAVGGLLVLAACAAQAAGGLPTYPSDFCSPAELLSPVRITIEPDRDPPVWGTRTESDERLELLWPADYSLREEGTEGLVVVDGEGRVIARDGTVLNGVAGGTDGSGRVELCPIEAV